MEKVNMVEYLDMGKTRRRIEDFLRKSVDEVMIKSIATVLGVPIATISLPEVSKEEIRQAEDYELSDKLSQQLPAEWVRESPISRELSKTANEIKANLPKKFVVYYVSQPRSSKDASPVHLGPKCFTKEAAEKWCFRRECEVTEQPQDIIDMRLRIRSTKLTDLLPEDRETFRRLKQLLFPAK